MKCSVCGKIIRRDHGQLSRGGAVTACPASVSLIARHSADVPPHMTGTARNRQTGETRVVTMTVRAAERAIIDCVCPAADGCRVEPDGQCMHGWPSKLIALGLV